MGGVWCESGQEEPTQEGFLGKLLYSPTYRSRSGFAASAFEHLHLPHALLASCDLDQSGYGLFACFGDGCQEVRAKCNFIY